jgi:hypothetical protein
MNEIYQTVHPFLEFYSDKRSVRLNGIYLPTGCIPDESLFQKDHFLHLNALSVLKPCIVDTAGEP